MWILVSDHAENVLTGLIPASWHVLGGLLHLYVSAGRQDMLTLTCERDLSNNQLAGTIPTAVFEKLKNLRFLYVIA